jgi:subtilisin-like proprotein convertase family protein
VSFDPDFGTAVVAGSTAGAFPDPEAFDCGTTVTAAGVWYTVVGTGSPIVASTCEISLFPGSADYDTKISVYCGTCDELTCVAGNDDEAGCNFHSETNWCSQFGATYYVYVHGFGTATGNFELALWDTGLPGCVVTASCLPTGGCCLGPDCVDDLTQIDCEGQGGVYQGDGVDCFVLGESLVFASFPNAAISSTLPPAVDSVNIAGSGIIGDVDVNLNITHTWVADLTITLEHAGVTVTLWDSACGSADNIVATANDDGGAPSCGPTTGEFAPVDAGGSPLSAFNGLDWNGDWTLTVADTVGGDDGTLIDWAVVVSSAGGPNPDVNCCEDVPVILCLAEPIGDGDDDDGDQMIAPNLSVGWDAQSPCGLDVLASGAIDIGCDVIPVENGQLIKLRCLRTDGDEPADICGSMLVDGVLVITSDVAVFTATAEDGNGAASCEIDLCALLGGGDDDDGDAITDARFRGRGSSRSSQHERDYTNLSPR